MLYLSVLSLISDLYVLSVPCPGYPVCLVCPMCPGYPVCLVCPIFAISTMMTILTMMTISTMMNWWLDFARKLEDVHKEVGSCTQISWRLYTRKLEVVHKKVGSYLTRYALPRQSLRMMNRQSLTHEGRDRAARAAKNVWQKEALSCRSCVVVDHNI